MPVEFRRQDEFAIITLNRPEALNALAFSVVEEIDAAIDQVAASDARAVIVTGAGDRAFCAGADIGELQSLPPVAFCNQMRRGQGVFARLDALPVISVAAINGFALGGGLELALACTFRVAAPHARLGLPEIKLGAVPGYGGTQRLPRLVGQGRALELVLSGRFADAAEAERIGLVNRVIEGGLLEGAMAFARDFTGMSLPALRLAREAVAGALDRTIADGLKVEADLAALAFTLEDAREGTSAFLEKRKPLFRDR